MPLWNSLVWVVYLTLKNLDFAGLPAGLTVVAKNAYLPTTGYGRGNRLSKPKWVALCYFPRGRKEWDPADVELKNKKAAIKFEDFDKIEIRGRSQRSSQSRGSDKLLKFRLDAGDGQDRQILSWYRQILSK
jgi:methionyl-tRNA synthetase